MNNNIDKYLGDLIQQDLTFDMKPLRIGAIVLGGLGDALDFWAWLAGCRKRFPTASIVAYTGNDRSNTAELLEKYSPANIALPFKRYLKRFGLLKLPIRGSSWQSLSDIERTKYDLFFDLRPYGCGIYKKMDNDYQFFCPDWFTEAYENMLSGHTANLTQMGLSVVALRNLATGMEGDYTFIQFPLNNLIEKLSVPYVTIHHGAQKGMKTKLWYVTYWAELTNWLKGKGYHVYQLGIKSEERIKGAISLLGKTSLFQTAAILKNAAHHIDTEGGLVRLAKCGNINQHCTVLGGATPKELFGFPDNNNIWLNVCEPCYLRVGFWNTECRWRLQGMEYEHRCMRKIYPELVIESLKEIL